MIFKKTVFIIISFIFFSCLKNEKVTIKSSENFIENFSFNTISPPIECRIENTEKKITASVPYGVNINNLVPTIKISKNAIISPKSEIAQNFNEPVIYNVTAENGSIQIYTVKLESNSIEYIYGTWIVSQTKTNNIWIKETEISPFGFIFNENGSLEFYTHWEKGNTRPFAMGDGTYFLIKETNNRYSLSIKSRLSFGREGYPEPSIVSIINISKNELHLKWNENDQKRFEFNEVKFTKCPTNSFCF